MVNERLQKLRWMNQIILSPSPPIYKTGSNNDFSKWARSPMAQPLSMGQNLLSENYFVTEPPERPIGTDNWSQPNPKLKSDRFHSMLDGVLAIDFNTFSLEKKPNKKLGEGFKFLRQDNDRLYISNDISISTRDVRPEDLEKVVTIENERGESDGPLGNLDVANNGPKFTWDNGLDGSCNVKQNIDKAVANTIWFQSFPSSIVIHENRRASDHCPIFLTFKEKVKCPKRRFRFEYMWTSYEDCEEIIKEGWGKQI
ncbi:hypothetical protein LguiA_000281 [Lonicera macranthoides]